MNHIEFSNFFKKQFKKKNVKLHLHEPIFDKSDINEINQCIKSGFVSSAGNQTLEFEKELKKFTKSKHVVAVVNGTMALYLALHALGIKKNHEVLLPSLTFVATANSILYCGAIPHFIDIEKNSLGVDCNKLKNYLKKIVIFKKNKAFNKYTGREIKALVPVHLYGIPVQMDNLMKIAKKYKLKVVEDAAESLGSFFKGKHTGLFGNVGVLSFNGNKIITTGGGGALITNSTRLAKNLKHLSTTAKEIIKFDSFHNKLGFNFRMPGLNASLGIAQIKKLKKYIQWKRKLNKIYQKIFNKNSNYKLIVENKNSKSNYWLNTIDLKTNSVLKRNMFIKSLIKKNINVRPIWFPLHFMPYLKKFPKMKLETTNNVFKSMVNLPSGPNIKFNIKNIK